ncbi:putative MFS-type transporter C19orf28 [Papilio machaon]|uniref:Putative MFS-type transporter C19orf28 n=1 Tax=Papilio machaon TaxID=76193 RepID=A0A194RH39_PAPMA|nr:putative MFS-type transporter C19orf28 [Papilio machaon]
MLIGQVVDALATPFVGYHSDHTDNYLSAKYGKRKLWHLFGTVCVLLSFPFIFMDCIGCSMAHKWAQMYYFASFILIFQIGWAAVQISHLSLIPELAEDPHVRTHLTAIRFGFTVFSNLFVYIITWIVLHMTGECDKEQVGPRDAWKFRHIVYIVLGVGTVASVLFHIFVSEGRGLRQQQPLIDYNDNNRVHFSIFRKGILYQVASIYMSTRLVVNISQVFIRGRSRGTLNRSELKLADYCTHIVLGFGGSQMLVTSLSLTADLVGDRTEASAFVYGLMSFTDKLSCGAVIAIIQLYADGASSDYYRSVLSWVCGGATVLGLICTLTTPKLTPDPQVTDDNNPSINTIEETGPPTDLL